MRGPLISKDFVHISICFWEGFLNFYVPDVERFQDAKEFLSTTNNKKNVILTISTSNKYKYEGPLKSFDCNKERIKIRLNLIHEAFNIS